jgi:hypothetical protein
MTQFSNAIVVASAGDLSMAPGSEISFTVTWGDNISPFRWSRIWPAVQSAADEANQQTVTVISEGSQWNSPASVALAVTLRGDSDLGATVVANIEVMACQDDTF